MKKLALTAMCVGALGLAACGGSSSSDTPDAAPISFTDASPTGNPDGGQAKCNPVTNTGCSPGDKCTVITDSGSGLSVTDCAPDGSVPLGGTCMLVAGQGYDDCAAKTLCSGGTCREICGSAPNTCSDGQCSQYGGLFDDVEGAGLCSATCDPVAQDCADATDGCFIVLSTGVATCEGQNEAGTAGVECTGPTTLTLVLSPRRTAWSASTRMRMRSVLPRCWNGANRRNRPLPMWLVCTPRAWTPS